MSFDKWDIVYPLRYPESIECTTCARHLTISPLQECPHCHANNTVTHIISKIRPMVLWKSQSQWYKSMTFGIPLSATGYYSDNNNQTIAISDCVFFDKIYEKPMRAVLCQATRADGTAIQSKHKVGQIVNLATRKYIEDKLFSWLFSD